MSTTEAAERDDATERLEQKERDQKRSQAKCFSNIHMTPVEFAVWTVSRSVAHQTGILYFDGRDMANLFKRTGKNRMYQAAKRLVKDGWFKTISPPRYDPRTGRFLCAQYRVLSHEEWSREHPNSCVAEPSIPETENGAIPDSGNGNDRSPKQERPFPEIGTTIPSSGTYFDKENLDTEDIDFGAYGEEETERTASAAAPDLGLLEDIWPRGDR